jgi:hypothetical protein
MDNVKPATNTENEINSNHTNPRGKLIFEWTVPEDQRFAMNNNSDNPDAYAVMEVATARDGVIVYGKQDGQWCANWHARGLVKHILSRLSAAEARVRELEQERNKARELAAGVELFARRDAANHLEELAALHKERTELQAQSAAMREALKAIQVYGDDTLSGRANGQDDHDWQREGVQEMTRRAADAIASDAGQPFLDRLSRAEAEAKCAKLIDQIRNHEEGCTITIPNDNAGFDGD